MCGIGASVPLFVGRCNVMKEVFTVSEKAIKERLGGVYDIGRYVEGKDYVRRKAFKGERVVFRKGILEETGITVSHTFEKDDIEPVCQVNDAVGASGPCECKVDFVYPNFRYAETSMGRVFLGMKGSSIRKGMIIRVKDNELYLKKV